MLTLEYRHSDKQKAKDFIEKLKNKLDSENKDKKIEILSVPNPNKRHNQFYYKLILK
jgi:hypothetical protein